MAPDPAIPPSPGELPLFSVNQREDHVMPRRLALQRLGNRQQGRDARRIVVRAIVDLPALHPDMVVVRHQHQRPVRSASSRHDANKVDPDSILPVTLHREALFEAVAYRGRDADPG